MDSEAHKQNTSDLDTPLKQVERLPLQEIVWQQLIDFSNRYYQVMDYLEAHPNADYMDVGREIESSTVRPHQDRIFRSKLFEFMQRRNVVMKELAEAPSQFGEEWQEKLFTKWTGQVPVGSITVRPDQTALIFVCHDARDFATSYAGQAGATIPQLLRIFGSHDFQRSAEDSKGRPLETSIIVVNAAARDKRLLAGQRVNTLTEFVSAEEAAIAAIITHERQHVINHLFARPFKGESEEYKQRKLNLLGNQSLQLSQKTLDILNTSDINGYSMPTELELIRKEILSSIARLKNDLSSLIQPLIKHVEEYLIKEEILAFYFSNTKPEEIDVYIPQYLQKGLGLITDIVGKLRIEVDDLLPTAALKHLGIVPLVGNQAAYFTDVQSEKHENAIANDWISQQFDGLYTHVYEIGQQLKKKASTALDQLERIQSDSKELPSKTFRKLMPILITHPIDRWPWIVDQALKYDQERNPR